MRLWSLAWALDLTHLKFSGASAELMDVDKSIGDTGRKTHGGHSGVVSWNKSAPELHTGLQGTPRLQYQLTESDFHGLA